MIDIHAEIAKYKSPNCAEDDVFYQAMEEVLYSIAPLFEKDDIYDKMPLSKG